jgi:hypothetical protein
MSVALIIQRISEACAADIIKPLPEVSSIPQLTTMGDLLKPWESVYPGSTAPEDDARDRGIFGYRKLQRPMIIPRARRSYRPLPAPRRIAPQPKLISPSLFNSVQGIWAWYQSRGQATDQLSVAPLNGAGLGAFLEPLWSVCSDYYPLGIYLEDCHIDTDVVGMDGFCLMLPHETYEEEHSGIVEAFLRGTDGLHWLMQNFYDERTNFDIELPDKDCGLIEDVGFEEILKCYAAFQGKKTVDLVYLENWDQNFFGEVSEKFPEQWSHDWPIISGGNSADNELPITCAADIDFALAFANAFYKMIDAIPTPWEFHENSDGITETFIHEICEVWRKVNRKRAVKWTSPKLHTLSYQIRVGEL